MGEEYTIKTRRKNRGGGEGGGRALVPRGSHKNEKKRGKRLCVKQLTIKHFREDFNLLTMCDRVMA